MSERSLAATPGDGPHAFWRIVFFLAVSMGAIVAGATLVAPAIARLSAAAGLRVDATPLVLSLAFVAAHVATLKLVDRRPWDIVRLGRRAARPSALLVGVAAGALAIGVPTLALLGIGWLRVEPAEPGSWWVAAARVSLFLAPAALWEELAFRGYLFTVVEESAGRVAALLGTSVLFGGIHLANPGAGLRSTALVTLAGVFLGAVMLATRSLYAAWAAHWAFNWMQAVAFHSAVSGAGLPTPDYRVVDAGPDWATGGAWGPEGGAGAALGMAAGALLLFARRARREGPWR